MTEVSYAKQFLTLLDSRPTKLSSDHVADPRNLPAQSAFILPRMPKPFEKPAIQTSTPNVSSQTSTTPQPTITIKLKTVRPTSSTPTDLTLTNQPPRTSIFDVKAQVARQTGYASDKVKILRDRKPVTDSKTVAEVVGEGSSGAEVELGMMFVGAPTAVPQPPPEPVTPVPNADAAAMEAAQRKDTGKAGGGKGERDTEMADAAIGKTGEDVLETKEFWEDLRGFVLQRVRDEAVATELVRRFRESWRVGLQGA